MSHGQPKALAFRPLAEADFPLMHRWLHQPHVSRWWGEPPTLERVAEHYSPRVLGEEKVESYLALGDGSPIGYLQLYFLDDYPQHREAAGLETGVAGVDMFIGEPDLLYRGLGPWMLGQFLDEVVFTRSEVQACIIDPAPDNAAAIRAYEKAGFSYLRTVQMPEEPVPAYLMIIPRPTG